jgi:hypothetical protein
MHLMSHIHIIALVYVCAQQLSPQAADAHLLFKRQKAIASTFE